MNTTMTETHVARSQPTMRKPHLSELDRLRIITALSVVAVHTLGNSTFLDSTPGALTLQDAFVTTFHFTREVFMFVTALALVYVYYGKPFHTGRFWRRRALGVLLPYSVWSVIYVIAYQHPTSIGGFIVTALAAILTGSASYQLYYILLTLEFYLIFPWFLRLLPRLARHLWTTLAVSFVLEVVILFLDHQALPAASLPPAITTFLNPFLDRFVLVYQFYFVLGAFTALHLPQIKAFLLRNGGWVIGAGVIGLVALEANFLIQALALHIPLSDAVAVLQPMMAPYSLGAIAFLFWLALILAQRTARRNARRVERAWSQLSDAAFGVYLVHPLFLGIALAVVVPPLRTRLPVALIVALLWALTAVCSVGLTIALLKTPVLSRFMGRPAPTPRWLTRWLAEWKQWRNSADSRIAPAGAFDGSAARRRALAIATRPMRPSTRPQPERASHYRRAPENAEAPEPDDADSRGDLAGAHRGES